MSKYTIPCTRDQIEKSLKLGAKEELLTAEEMIGWLEEQGFDITASSFCVAVDYEHVGTLGIYSGYRKEATLTAIDTALEYISQHKTPL